MMAIDAQCTDLAICPVNTFDIYVDLCKAVWPGNGKINTDRSAWHIDGGRSHSGRFTPIRTGSFFLDKHLAVVRRGVNTIRMRL